ncbi:MAG: sulfide/dihydroorotate dehydrogenase-like FAD/NAD-binding protein, partial [Anaerococcus vaginalis]|nr:sulfide/dihydroorotate dehydrogenase-like FAD/NAD-binding protein [Anaerococcus vaginalis]
PDFDAFEVDFDEAMNRGRNYQQEEREHICRLTGDMRNGKI